MTRINHPTVLAWSAQIIAAGILAQTLYFKFTGAPESIYIFTTLGMEPWGRIASGFAELVCVVMLLTPRLAVYGAIGALAVISGAIGGHLTKLGLVVMNDGGLLFALACIVFVCSACIAWLRRAELSLIRRLRVRPA